MQLGDGINYASKGHHPGFLCAIMNLIVYNEGRHEDMKIKSILLRYILCYLLFLIGPFFVLPGGIVFMIFFIPYYVWNEFLRYN